MLGFSIRNKQKRKNVSYFLIGALLFVFGFILISNSLNENLIREEYYDDQIKLNSDFKIKEDSYSTQSIYTNTTIKQIRILFDEAHEPELSIQSNDAFNGIGFVGLARDLRAEGHYVEATNTLLNSSYLSDFDILVIPASHHPYQTEEFDVIDLFVKNGGSLLFMFDQANEHLNSIAELFGYSFDAVRTIVHFEQWDFNDYYHRNYYSISGINEHEITTGVTEIDSTQAFPIVEKPSGAIDLVETNFDGSMCYYNLVTDTCNYQPIFVPIMSCYNGSLIGDGRIVVIGDTSLWNIFENSMPGSHKNYFEEGNQRLAKNTFNWLIKNETVKILDSDNDNITDYKEYYVYNSNPYSNDTDQDGLSDTYEMLNNLILTSNDTDTDGLTDYEEVFVYPTDPVIFDSDKDDLGDGDEILVYYTNPLVNDTDTDGIFDGYEASNQLDPNNSSDANLDKDLDNLTNIEEFLLQTSSLSNDTDQDGLTDYEEVKIYNTKPLKIDSDFDDLSDYDELFIYHTDPLKRDTDWDGFDDDEEILNGTDPLDPNDPEPQETPTNTQPSPTIAIGIPEIFLGVTLTIIFGILFIIRKRMKHKL